MARPRKLTMDFFIHDANASADKKIKLISKKHGNDGYATYFRLLESLCHEPGMQLSLKDPEMAELLAEDYRLRDIQHLYKIIQCCADIRLFDKQLWESDRVVFSHGLFDRYSDRLEDRKDAAIRKKRSREAKALQEKLDTLNEVVTRDNPVTSEMSQDCHSPDTDTDTDPEIRTSEPQNPKPDVALGSKSIPSQPMQITRRPVDVIAAQFSVKPWRVDGGIDKGFCLYIGGKMPAKKDEPNEPAWKGRRAIINAEKSNDPLELEKFMFDWDDYQESQATTPAQSAADISRLAKQAIAQERTS